VTGHAYLELEHFLPYRLSVLSNRISQEIARLYADRFQLNVTEWRLLAVLGRYPDLTATELVERTAMDKVAVSRAVASLVADGRLTRKVDGEEIKTNLDLIGKIAHHRPGEKVQLEVWREGKPRTLEVTLGARDAEKITGRLNRKDDPEGSPGHGSSEPENAQALGIKVRDITPAMRRQLGNVQGVMVDEVDVQAEASDEGIEHGTVITQVNRTAIHDIDDFRDAFSKLKPGDPVRLTLRDGEQERSVYLTMPRR